jgi:uncharacterized protein YggT (Ycf19 family)
VPRIAMIDLTPIVALILMDFIRRALFEVIRQSAFF